MVPDVINVQLQMVQADKEGYLHRMLVALDQFLNVIFRGRPGETISARSYRAALEGHVWGVILNFLLNIVQDNHGAKACAGDLARALSIAATEAKVLGVNLDVKLG
jgi:hypothetical protein